MKFKKGDRVKYVGKTHQAMIEQNYTEGEVDALQTLKVSPTESVEQIKMKHRGGTTMWINADEFVLLETAPPIEGTPVRPNYYQATIRGNTFDVLDICYAFDLDLMRGNAVKYAIRAGKKNPEKELEDLDKAIECLQRYRQKVVERK